MFDDGFWYGQYAATLPLLRILASVVSRLIVDKHAHVQSPSHSSDHVRIPSLALIILIQNASYWERTQFDEPC